MTDNFWRFSGRIPAAAESEANVCRVLCGKRHLRYINQHHKIRYTNLLTSCKLTTYLADIDEQAEDMFFLLVKQLAEKEGVTEQIRADNQMLWVAKMNNIRNSATEIVNTELICT